MHPRRTQTFPRRPISTVLSHPLSPDALPGVKNTLSYLDYSDPELLGIRAEVYVMR
jgi:hypothetical protein